MLRNIQSEKYEQVCRKENERKSFLMQLFEPLEEAELPFADTYDYHRTYRGMATVKRISLSTLGLVDEDGRKMGSMCIYPNISEYIRVDDTLMVSMGFRQGFWRLHYVSGILSRVID